MIQVQANDAIQTVIGTLKGRAEVLGDRGEVVGYLIPVDPEEDALYREAAQLFDRDRIRASKADSSPGYTTAEVLERLRSIAIG